MSDQSFWGACRPGYRVAGMILAVILAGLLGTCPLLGGKEAAASRPETKRHVVGKSLAADGMILSRQKPDTDYQVVRQGQSLGSGNLLLGMDGAEVSDRNDRVRLIFRSNLSGKGLHPIVESVVALHEDPAVDLDFTLDRGRVVVVNHQDKGSAHVRVRVRQQFWDLTLEKPGARIGMEVYSRWLPGAPFRTNPRPTDVPFAELLFLVLQGQVDLKYGDYEQALSAPPGPAFFEWDNVSGADATPQYLAKLPSWATPEGNNTPLAKAKRAALERFRKLVLARGLPAAIAQALNSDDPMARRLALFAMGAVDDLEGLGQALTEAKHADVWENGVLALRHWIGRGPGQDQKLYRLMVDQKKIPPAQAETIMELLHGFSDRQRAEPETYQVLIEYLGSDRLAIRGLANWHLQRLAPVGHQIQYNPLASKEERDRDQREWRKLIPPGHLPPKVKPEGK